MMETPIKYAEIRDILRGLEVHLADVMDTYAKSRNAEHLLMDSSFIEDKRNSLHEVIQNWDWFGGDLGEDEIKNFSLVAEHTTREEVLELVDDFNKLDPEKLVKEVVDSWVDEEEKFDSTKDSIVKMMGSSQSDDMGLYINDRLICVGPIDKLMANCKGLVGPGDKMSFRAIDEPTSSDEHRSGKAPRWDEKALRKPGSLEVFKELQKLNAPPDEKLALYIDARLVMMDSLSKIRFHLAGLNPSSNLRIKVLREGDPEHPYNRLGNK